MDAEMRAMVDRIARGGPEAMRSAIEALSAKVAATEAEPEPTTSAGWGRKEIRDLAAKGQQAVRTRRASAHTEPCRYCPDSPDGPFNEQNEKDHCSIHGSRLHRDADGVWCESCRSS